MGVTVSIAHFPEVICHLCDSLWFKDAGSYPEWLFYHPNQTTSQIKLNCLSFLKHYFLWCFCFIRWNEEEDDRNDRWRGMQLNPECDEYLEYKIMYFGLMSCKVTL